MGIFEELGLKNGSSRYAFLTHILLPFAFFPPNPLLQNTDNSIADAGAQAVAEGLSLCTGLEQLDLAGGYRAADLLHLFISSSSSIFLRFGTEMDGAGCICDCS